MTTPDLLIGLGKANLAASAAILLVIAARKPARALLGARLAYWLWLLPLAAAAVLLPARTVWITRPLTVLHPASIAGPSAPSALALPPSSIAAAPAPVFDWSPALLSLWLAGVLLAALWLLLKQHEFELQARTGGAGPAVVGLIRPRIVLPQDFDSRFSAPERAAVLAHEHVHLARQDARFNGLAALLRCLCWFNPLAHIAAFLMRVDQELACDAVVIARQPGTRRAYAEALLKAELADRPLPLGCYWPAGTRHPLTERIAMLKLNGPSQSRRLMGAAAIALVATGTGLTAWAAQPAQTVTRYMGPATGVSPSGIKAEDVEVLRFGIGFQKKDELPALARARACWDKVADLDKPADEMPVRPQSLKIALERQIVECQALNEKAGEWPSSYYGDPAAQRFIRYNFPVVRADKLPSDSGLVAISLGGFFPLPPAQAPALAETLKRHTPQIQRVLEAYADTLSQDDAGNLEADKRIRTEVLHRVNKVIAPASLDAAYYAVNGFTLKTDASPGGIKPVAQTSTGAAATFQMVYGCCYTHLHFGKGAMILPPDPKTPPGPPIPIVQVEQGGKVYLGATLTTEKTLAADLRRLKSLHPDLADGVALRAGPKVRYENVMRILNALTDQGFRAGIVPEYL